MGVHDSGGVQRAGLGQDVFHAAANLTNRGDYCTLILDRAGRILSCGNPAERMLGDSQVRLVGRRISEFVSGLFLEGSSPSFTARYLVYLCSDGDWRRFDAVDACGRAIAVELNLARMASSGSEKDMFLLNLRRSEPANHA